MRETGAAALDLRDRARRAARREAGGAHPGQYGSATQLRWDEVRSRPADAARSALPLAVGGGGGMGNPHCVFVVEDAEAVDLREHGAADRHDRCSRSGPNVEIVQVLDRGTIRMRVWEQGRMITLACGSGACAAAVVTAQRGLTERAVTVRLDGGDPGIDWRADGGLDDRSGGPRSSRGRLTADFRRACDERAGLHLGAGSMLRDRGDAPAGGGCRAGGGPRRRQYLRGDGEAVRQGLP